MRKEYIEVETPNIHIGRKKEIMAKYPQAKELMGQNPWSALWILMIVGVQLFLASVFQNQSYLYLVLGAYLIGAYAQHALFVQIHECTHNLVFKKTNPNKIMGIICDTPLFVPGALAFRKYHMIHHRHMGEYSMDPDVASRREAELIGNSTFRKALWMIFFGVSQALRPMKVKNVKLMDGWILANIIYVIGANLAIFYFFGGKALLYLGLSTLFGLGPHPVGGRWIQEHFVTKEGQETYSYYGPLNKLSFNVGYHNEHHDLMNVPWNNLPKLKAMAPEYYDSLYSYQSWTYVLWNFITNKSLSVFDRILHPDKKLTSV